MLNVENLIKELEIALESEPEVKYKITVKRTKKGREPSLMVRLSNGNDSVDTNANEYSSISLLMSDLRDVLRNWEVPSFTR